MAVVDVMVKNHHRHDGVIYLGCQMEQTTFPPWITYSTGLSLTSPYPKIFSELTADTFLPHCWITKPLASPISTEYAKPLNHGQISVTVPYYCVTTQKTTLLGDTKHDILIPSKFYHHFSNCWTANCFIFIKHAIRHEILFTGQQLHLWQ
jgi:hypothetical protein